MGEKKKKPRKSKAKALADRVYKHYKALKRTSNGLEFVATSHCTGCDWSTWPHYHGYNKVVTQNSDWLWLARTHGISVREVKDIVTARRGWNKEKIVADKIQAIKVHEEGAEYLEILMKERNDSL